MDISTAIGLLLGIGLVGQGIVFGHGQLMWFLNPPAIGIVLGGTLAATLVNYSFGDVLQVFKVTKIIFGRQKWGYQQMITSLVEKAEKGGFTLVTAFACAVDSLLIEASTFSFRSIVFFALFSPS